MVRALLKLFSILWMVNESPAETVPRKAKKYSTGFAIGPDVVAAGILARQLGWADLGPGAWLSKSLERISWVPIAQPHVTYKVHLFHEKVVYLFPGWAKRADAEALSLAIVSAGALTRLPDGSPFPLAAPGERATS